jgi:hypothetical protein
MKNTKTILFALCLVAAMKAHASAAAAAPSIISKDALTDGSYCHMKFPAIVESTLSSPHPLLKDASSGDIIDFYGPCNHDPLGGDEIHSQLIQLQHRRTQDYMD